MLDDMSTTSSAPTATARPTGWTVPRSVAWFRYGLLALCATVGIGMLAFGTRPADFNELGRAINAGRVTQVVIANALPENATGTASAEIRWHDGFLPRYTKAGRLTGGWSFLLFCVLGASIVQNLL